MVVFGLAGGAVIGRAGEGEEGDCVECLKGQKPVWVTSNAR